MGQNALDQPASQTLTALGFVNDNVREISIDRKVGNGAGETDQRGIFVQAEANGVRRCPFRHVKRQAAAPRRAMQQCQCSSKVSLLPVGSNGETAALKLLRLVLHGTLNEKLSSQRKRFGFLIGSSVLAVNENVVAVNENANSAAEGARKLKQTFHRVVFPVASEEKGNFRCGNAP
jgi:hypothetical protein